MSRTRRSAWTREEVESFRAWHTDLLTRLAYSDAVVEELAHARDKWLLGVPVVRT